MTSILEEQQTLPYDNNLETPTINQEYFLAHIRSEKDHSDTQLSKDLQNDVWVNQLVEKFVATGYQTDVGTLLAELPFDSVKLLHSETLLHVTDVFNKYPRRLADMVIYAGERTKDINSTDPSKATPYSNLVYLSGLGYTKRWQEILNNLKQENSEQYEEYIEEFKSRELPKSAALTI